MAVELPLFDDILNAAYIYLSSLDEHNLLKRKYIMNDLEKLCRFCLKQTNYSSFGDVKIIRDMLSALNLKMNLDISEEPVICGDCTENLHRFFTFKVICVETENRLMSFINPEVDKNICLSQIYLQINNSESLDNKDVCRFCLCATPSGSAMQLNTVISLTSPIKNDLEKFFPEMNFNLVRDPMMCKICFNSLLEYLMFTKKCLATEENIQRYLVVDAIDVNIKLDLKRVQQFLDREIIKEQIDDIDMFEPVKHELQKGGDIKEELLSEEDIKSENCIQIEDPQLDIKEDNLDLKFVVDSYASIPAAIKEIGKQEVGEFIKKRETAPICKGTMYKCEKEGCSYETKHKYYLTKHRLTHKNLSEVTMYKCEFEGCSYETKCKYNLTIHLLTHKVSSEVTMYTCEIEGCSYETKHKRYWAGHVLTHTDCSGAVMYKCEGEGCSYETKHKYNLTKHLLTHKDSSEVTTYKCESEGCSYETKRKNYLSSHQLTHKDPSEVTMYKCESEGCSYETKRKNYLTSHQLMHKDPSEVTMYKCEIKGCSYETKRKHYLPKHLLTHKGSSEVTVYKFKSEEYSYETKRKYDLSTNLRTYKGPAELRMYKCETEGCLYQARGKNNWIKHQLIHQDYSEATR